MPEQIAIEDLAIKQDKNGKEYFLIKTTGGKSFGVFDDEHKAVFIEAKDNSLWVNAELEQSGKYLNLKSASLVKSEVEKLPPQTTRVQPHPKEGAGALTKDQSIAEHVTLKAIIELDTNGLLQTGAWFNESDAHKLRDWAKLKITTTCNTCY